VKGRRFTSRDVLVEEKQMEKNADTAMAPQTFYLLSVDERQVARTKLLDEVREEIEKELLVLERSRLRKKWIDRLKNKSFVSYF
jgi:hypothetical protein